MMNTDRIYALADLIETQEHAHSRDTRGFNMNIEAHDCGTPSCIAGFAAWEKLGRPEVIAVGDTQEIADIAREYLGISSCLAEDLFYLGDVPSRYAIPAYEKISPAEAASVLRGLADTGEVNWMAVIEKWDEPWSI